MEDVRGRRSEVSWPTEVSPDILQSFIAGVPRRAAVASVAHAFADLPESEVKSV